MKNVIKSDFFKLMRDRQTIFIFAIFIVYTILDLATIGLTDFTSEEILMLVTSDFAVIFIVVTLVSTAVFALDYSNATLKDILPYFPRSTVYFSKWVSVILVAVISLLFCYAVGAIAALFFAVDLISFQIILTYFIRFVTQFVIILANIGFVLLLSSFFKHRYLMNTIILVSLIVVRFIPAGNSRFLFQMLTEQYTWGSGIDAAFILLSVTICSFFASIGFIRFINRGID